MVLPILIASTPAQAGWPATRAEDPARSSGRGRMATARTKLVAHANARDQNWPKRLPVARRFWPCMAIPGELPTSSVPTTAQTPSEGAMPAQYERTCLQLLRRWRAQDIGSGVRACALTRQCGSDGRLPADLATTEIVQWLLQAMYWRGCSHPRAMVEAPLHLATGVMRWMNRFDLHRGALPTAFVTDFLVQTMKAIRCRAHVIALREQAQSTRNGWVRLDPQLLDDEVWLKFKPFGMPTTVLASKTNDLRASR